MRGSRGVKGPGDFSPTISRPISRPIRCKTAMHAPRLKSGRPGSWHHPSMDARRSDCFSASGRSGDAEARTAFMSSERLGESRGRAASSSAWLLTLVTPDFSPPISPPTWLKKAMLSPCVKFGRPSSWHQSLMHANRPRCFSASGRSGDTEARTAFMSSKCKWEPLGRTCSSSAWLMTLVSTVHGEGVERDKGRS